MISIAARAHTTSPIGKKGIITAGRIKKLAEEVSIETGKTFLVINKTENADELKEIIQKNNLNLLTIMPEDEEIKKKDLLGEPIVTIKNIQIREKINKILEEIK